MKRIVATKVELYRDNAGFWMARIEDEVTEPGIAGVFPSFHSMMLPVSPSASRAEAEAAFRRVMFHEWRRNGR